MLSLRTIFAFQNHPIFCYRHVVGVWFAAGHVEHVAIHVLGGSPWPTPVLFGGAMPHPTLDVTNVDECIEHLYGTTIFPTVQQAPPCTPHRFCHHLRAIPAKLVFVNILHEFTLGEGFNRGKAIAGVNLYCNVPSGVVRPPIISVEAPWNTEGIVLQRQCMQIVHACAFRLVRAALN